MEPAAYALIGVAVGGGIIGLVWFLLRDKLAHAATNEKHVLQERLFAREHEITQLQERLNEVESRLQHRDENLFRSQAEVVKLQSRLEHETRQSQEKIELLNAAGRQLKTEFENLANKIFHDRTQHMRELNVQTLDAMLKPFTEQLKDFGKRVDDTYSKDTRERASLLTEIKQLRDLNQQLSQDAANLATALKGQTKTQGNWGEVVLARILEQSGLRDGIEYETQSSHRGKNGKLFRPDVIVHLPQNKDVIIDSKVSLTAYEQYVSADGDNGRAGALRSHLQSVRNHVRELSVKRYEDIPSIHSLDFVLMFLPVEGAFLTVLQEAPELCQEAFMQSVVIVGPSTLMVNLRTIQSLWRWEHQNRNAVEIAEQAGALHDHFVRFVDDLQSIRHQLGKAGDACDLAFKHLADGRGNLIRRAEQLKELGAKAKSSLPAELGN